MRIFLCGGGSGEQTKSVYEKFSEEINHSKPLLYIPIAREQSSIEQCNQWIHDELFEYGVNDIEMIKSFQELYEIDMEKYGGIFIGGRKHI